MKLPRGVTVGLVAGVMAPMTPMGWAISMTPLTASSLMMPTDFLSFR